MNAPADVFPYVENYDPEEDGEWGRLLDSTSTINNVLYFIEF